MKFDYSTLDAAGIKLPVDNLWCTMMMSVYIDENHIPGHDLDTVFKRYLGEQKKLVEASALKKFGWEKAPVEYMQQYAEQDCKPLPALYNKLRSVSQEKHLKLWEEVDRPFMLLLAEMEMRGILINRELCSEYWLSVSSSRRGDSTGFRFRSSQTIFTASQTFLKSATWSGFKDSIINSWW